MYHTLLQAMVQWIQVVVQVYDTDRYAPYYSQIKYSS
jgi:hypothetical protein